MSKWTALTVVLVLVGMVHSAMGAGEVVKLVEKPDVSGGNDYYVGNREPLLASPFVKLPIGAIEPQGWVRKQLELEADGFTGHLTEISKFLKKENNAWLSSEGVGDFPWEEMPYWLKGFGDLGYILGNERIIKEAKIWIEGFLGSQREDGYFGPRANLRGAHGPGGGCRTPESWWLMYKDSDQWKPVAGASGYGVEKNKYNRVTFDAVETDGLRLEVELQKEYSGGILEWRVF